MSSEATNPEPEPEPDDQTDPDGSGISRRQFLDATGKTLAVGAIASGGIAAMGDAASAETTSSSSSSPPSSSSQSTAPKVAAPGPYRDAALSALGRTTLREPGTRFNADLAIGADTLPGIEQIVVLMMENHSYDNIFGMLDKGDGFTLDANGDPTATNPYPNGQLQLAFRMPTTCQLSSSPSQEWAASHNSYDDGANDGFVSTAISSGSTDLSGAVAMGFWTGDDLPYTYSLAQSFPIADRWFCSLLGQTDPNRRFLIAGTSAGMTDDVGSWSDLNLLLPAPNGTIFNLFDAHGITWANYAESFPTGATPELYPINDLVTSPLHYKPFSQFYTDAAAGNLPQFTLLDPDYDNASQHNPQNIVIGEAVIAQVVAALGASPQWSTTLFVLTYDEHGGYYDHVPPPPALVPDDIAPLVQPGESTYDGFGRYGFRVPTVVVSPYAKPGYVSHLVYDHTSVLAMVERKWNLPALTYRDANANDLTDFLDLDALAAGRPTFPTLPPLAAPGNTPAALACSANGPGTIPPPGTIIG
jgi:phospholipase C